MLLATLVLAGSRTPNFGFRLTNDGQQNQNWAKLDELLRGLSRPVDRGSAWIFPEGVTTGTTCPTPPAGSVTFCAASNGCPIAVLSAGTVVQLSDTCVVP